MQSPRTNLISYQKFSELRLRTFGAPDDDYAEFIVGNSRGQFVTEQWRGTWTSRWSEHPDDLALVGIDIHGWNTDLANQLLAVIGLPLAGGMSAEETASVFGIPPRYRRNDGRFAIFQTTGENPYEVRCFFSEQLRLLTIAVHRLDIELPEGE